MSKIVRKDLKTIKAELDYAQLVRELSLPETPEEEGLGPEALSKFKPVGQRFKKCRDRGSNA